jgi:hypothetical protein
MADQVPNDKMGRILGKISSGSNGVLTIKTPMGRTKGTYDPKTDKTKGPMGRTVGSGNLVATLL